MNPSTKCIDETYGDTACPFYKDAMLLRRNQTEHKNDALHGTVAECDLTRVFVRQDQSHPLLNEIATKVASS